MDNRNPIWSPVCGDIVKMPDNGQYLLVDYADPMVMGFTREDGTRAAFKYRQGWSLYVKGAEIVQRGDKTNWPWPSDDKTEPDQMQASLYLHDRIREHRGLNI